MTITISNSGPDDVNEYASFSGTFTVTDSLAGTQTVAGDPLAVPPVAGSNVWYENPKIVKVVASEAWLPGLTMNITGDNTVEYSGHFDDVFERHWKYVMANNSKGDVPKVIQLPSDYLALYAFVPPAVQSKVITFSFYAWTYDNDANYSNNPSTPYGGNSLYATVPANLSTITSSQMTLVGTRSITVHYNWSSDSAAFQSALQAGTLYQQALAKGLV